MGFLHSMAKVFGYGFKPQMEKMAVEMEIKLTWIDDDTAYTIIVFDDEPYTVIFVNNNNDLVVIVRSQVKFRPGRAPIWLTSEMLKGNESRDWGNWQMTDGKDDSHLALTLRFTRSNLKTAAVMEMVGEMLEEVVGMDAHLNSM